MERGEPESGANPDADGPTPDAGGARSAAAASEARDEVSYFTDSAGRGNTGGLP